MTRPTLLFSLLLVALAPAQMMPGIEAEGPFVRVKRNEDGTRTVFEREEDKKTMVKKTFDQKGNLTLRTVYRMDRNGNPLLCNIYDGLGNRLYKTKFGYSKRPGPTFGKLVLELLYDTRVKRIDPATREEMPVHKFIYSYNADGSANLPVGITMIKGKTAEEVFGRSVESQAVPELGWDDEKTPANPAARPVGGDR